MKPTDVQPLKAMRGFKSIQPFSTNVPRLTFLLPGYPQWTAGLGGRGVVLASSYLTACVSSLLLWGTPSSWVLLAAAIVLQALSWFDAARQNPFAGLTPSPVLAVTGLGLSVGLHSPLIGLLTLMAWPSYGPDPSDGSYLVNRLAYKDRMPAAGQWVWLDGSATGIQSAAKVIAIPGQEVEWTGKVWKVDGEVVPMHPSRQFPNYTRKWTFRVPSNHVLIDPEANAQPGEARAPLIMVETGHITGRVWARCAPLWERGLL